jgi:dihydroxyacetone kinase phosphotransfer subunit
MNFFTLSSFRVLWRPVQILSVLVTEPVGIVLVSHSPQLAEGLRELLLQLGADPDAVRVAAGTDDGRLGTSDARVRAAIEQADRGSGTLILADLGSAVLTARLVLDDYPDAVLVDAPFVEGAVSAAVIAATGADLATVTLAAQESRNATKF